MNWRVMGVNLESVTERQERQDKDLFELVCGYVPCKGCIAEVIKGRKFPIGMKFAVTGFYTRYYPNGTKCYLEFYDEGFRKTFIDGENVRIVAYDREENPVEYKNVHNVEVYI